MPDIRDLVHVLLCPFDVTHQELFLLDQLDLERLFIRLALKRDDLIKIEQG